MGVPSVTLNFGDKFGTVSHAGWRTILLPMLDTVRNPKNEVKFSSPLYLYLPLSPTFKFLWHPDKVRPVHPGPAGHVREGDVGAARQAIAPDCAFSAVWKS